MKPISWPIIAIIGLAIFAALTCGAIIDHGRSTCVDGWAAVGVEANHYGKNCYIRTPEGFVSIGVLDAIPLGEVTP